MESQVCVEPLQGQERAFLLPRSLFRIMQLHAFPRNTQACAHSGQDDPRTSKPAAHRLTFRPPSLLQEVLCFGWAEDEVDGQWGM